MVVIVGSLLHELFHAIIVWSFGGELVKFQWYPTSLETLGQVSFFGPVPKIPLSIAPVLGRIILSAVTFTMLPRQPSRQTRWFFVLGWLLPLGDISMAIASFFLRRPSADLYKVFHAAPERFYVVAASAMGVALWLTPGLFARAFPRGALAPLEIRCGLAALLLAVWIR